MKNLKDIFVKRAYYMVRDNKISEPVVFSTIENYTKQPMTDHQKEIVREYIRRVKSGEMSFDEYWALYKSKDQAYETNP